MSNTAVLDRAVVDDQDWVVLDETTTYASQYAMRFGPRAYTAEQAGFIEWTVRARTPLLEPHLPIDD